MRRARQSIDVVGLFGRSGQDQPGRAARADDARLDRPLNRDVAAAIDRFARLCGLLGRRRGCGRCLFAHGRRGGRFLAGWLVFAQPGHKRLSLSQASRGRSLRMHLATDGHAGRVDTGGKFDRRLPGDFAGVLLDRQPVPGLVLVRLRCRAGPEIADLAVIFRFFKLDRGLDRAAGDLAIE